MRMWREPPCRARTDYSGQDRCVGHHRYGACARRCLPTAFAPQRPRASTSFFLFFPLFNFFPFLKIHKHF